MKQTAVEWLVRELTFKTTGGVYTTDGIDDVTHLIEKAKETERWQIMNAYDIGWLDCKNSGGKELNDQYYFETFNTNEK